jgi:hypothetical protein
MEFEPRVYWSVRLFYGSKQKFSTPAAPNWFHRLMQRLLLGIVWERL